MRNRLLSYVVALGATLPGSPGGRRAITLLRAALCLPFLVFPLAASRPAMRWLVGGPSRRLIDCANVEDRDLTLCDVSSIPRCWWSGRPFVNLALLYVATALYCFVSRRFAGFFRRVARSYRSVVVARGIPEVIVWHSDALPLVRALRYVLRGLPTLRVCIQHGYFHGPFPGEIDGSRSDLVVLYDPAQAAHFIASGVAAERLVFAPELLTFAAQLPQRIDRGERTIWLVGEGWWSHDRRVDDLVFAMYREVRRLFVRAGWRVRYRPHPSQLSWLSRYLVIDPGAAFRSRQPISTDDVYIGVSSSFIVFCAGAGARACFVDSAGRIAHGLDACQVPVVPINELVEFAQAESREIAPRVFGDRFRLAQILDLALLDRHRLTQGASASVDQAF